jgi:hypothetical protein
MKIIGTAGQYKVIVEMEHNEFTKISGEYSTGYNAVTIDKVVNVRENWEALKLLETNKAQIINNANTLKAMAQLLENLPDIGK